MIPTNALVTQLQSYLHSTEPQLVQAADPIQELQALFAVGDQVHALVTGQLPSGRFSVLVQDQLLDLNLPRNTEPGAELDMRVVANSPKLAFLVERDFPPTASPDQQPAQNASSNVALSNAGKFLGELLAQAQAQTPEGERAVVQQNAAAAPLIEGEHIDPQQLAAALKQTLSESGMFYESHVAAWAQGERDLDSLLREPQGQLSRPQLPDVPAKTPEAAERGQAQEASANQQAGQSTLPERRLDTTDNLNHLDLSLAAQTNNSQGKSLDEMPSSIRQLVQQQLQTLDQRAVVWQGQAWQGQPLRWEVEEDRSGRTADDPEAPPVWRTRLYLDLPNLGSVEAMVSLSDRKRVEVNFRVASDDTASRIRDETDRLRTRFDAAGLELVSQQVNLTQDDE